MASVRSPTMVVAGDADGFPPAQAAAGYPHLEQFTAVGEAEIPELHGMGPEALGMIREALHARGLSFRDVARDAR